MRMIGLVSTQAGLNHVREMAVIEVIARAVKVLVKDGLTFLAEDEKAGFNDTHIK